MNPRLLQKKGTSGDISDDGEDEGKEDEQEEEEEEGTEEGKRMDVSNNNDLADIGTTELLKGSTEKVFDETETGLEESEQMKRKEIKTTVGKMFPVLPKVFSWSDHVMVSKLVGTPLQHTASGSERTLFVLGKKSFWMESRAREVDHRLIKDNENFQLEKERWSALPSELKKSMRQKINFQYPFSSQQPPFYRQKNPPIESRKADFLDTVNKMNIEKKKFVDDTASIEEADDNIDNSSWKS